MTVQPDATDAARRLLSAGAVRERAHRLLAAGLEDRLDHFTVHTDRLDDCADAVVATIRANYPDLDIPFHARWRHFAAGGVDRWAAVAAAAPWPDDAAMARAAFDLAIVSVLLDAGAGSAWRYHEGRTGEIFTRSEGLAVASFDLFVGAWIAQFVGHKLEGRKPSFFEDLQYLWIGPIFVLSKLFLKLGIRW